MARIGKALCVAGGFHDDGDHTAAVSHGSGGHTVAGFGNRAGLETIQPLVGRHGIEHVVGVVVITAVEADPALAGDAQDVGIGVDEDFGQLGL